MTRKLHCDVCDGAIAETYNSVSTAPDEPAFVVTVYTDGRLAEVCYSCYCWILGQAVGETVRAQGLPKGRAEGGLSNDRAG